MPVPGEYRRGSRGAWLALALGGLAGPGLGAPPRAGADCVIHAPATATVGKPSTFTLACEPAYGGLVRWELGDGAVRDSAPATVTHTYLAPGGHTVFARLPGEDIPASRYVTVLHPVTAVAPTRSGTLLLDGRRGRLWNVNTDNHSVTVHAVSGGGGKAARLREIPVGRSPRTLAQDSLGRIWVANQDDATLSVIDGATLSVALTVALPRASRPYGVVLDPALRNLYVTLEGLGAVLRLDPADGDLRDSLAVFPSPRGLAVTADGRSVWVTRFLSPRDRGEVARLRAEPLALQAVIPLAEDEGPDTESTGRGVPNALASITLSPDGRRAWVPFKKDNVRRGMRASGGGGPDPLGPQEPTFESTVRTAVGQIDLATGKEDADARLDLDNRSLACAVAFARGGAFAFVATCASNETAVIDAALNARATAIEPLLAGQDGHELGPDGLEVSGDDSLLYIHYAHSREVAIYGIAEVGASNLMPRLALLPTVERERLAPEVLKGKQVFHNAADPRMARHKYLSCGVCHLDGAADGRVWDFTHKGEGLRRTTSLLGRAGLGQGPLHWSANFDEVQDFEHDMRGAFGGTGFLDDAAFGAGTRGTSLGDRKAGVDADLDALAAYVTSLSRARPSPFRKPDGSLTEAGRRGEAIFRREDVGCAKCHAGEEYTDSRFPAGSLLHDVGTLRPWSGGRLGDTLRGLDTPTLLGLWEGGPYLHDGSAEDLPAVLTTANAGDRHGRTSQLSEAERQDLVAFLLQIEDADEAVGVRRAAGSARGAGPGIRVERRGAGLLFALAGRAGAGPTAWVIRDAQGRVRRTLGGSGSVPWDGRDAGGRACPPGAYVAEAKGQGFRAAAAFAWMP